MLQIEFGEGVVNDLKRGPLGNLRGFRQVAPDALVEGPEADFGVTIADKQIMGGLGKRAGRAGPERGDCLVSLLVKQGGQPGNDLTATDFICNSAATLNFGAASFPSNEIHVHPTGPTPFDSWMGCC